MHLEDEREEARPGRGADRGRGRHVAVEAVAFAARHLFYELKIDCPRDVPLRCDNQSTIKQSLNQVDQRRCRHLGMKTHFLRQQCHAAWAFVFILRS